MESLRLPGLQQDTLFHRGVRGEGIGGHTLVETEGKGVLAGTNVVRRRRISGPGDNGLCWEGDQHPGHSPSCLCGFQ